jgi:hypothetical protein
MLGDELVNLCIFVITNTPASTANSQLHDISFVTFSNNFVPLSHTSKLIRYFYNLISTNG